MAQLKTMILMVAFLLGGCSAQSLPTVTISPTSSAVHTVTPVLTWSPAVTRTIAPLPTLTPMSTETSEPDTQHEEMQFQCLEIQQNLVGEFRSDGVLVLFDFRGDSSNYLLDMKTGAQTVLAPEEGGFLVDFEVSPDGKWLAYGLNANPVSPVDWRLFIVTADGQTYKVLPWEEDWRMIAGWLDNERLLINQKGVRRYDLDSLVVLNPFSEQSEELIPSYPKINGTSWMPWNFSKTVYDPTLTRVIYPLVEGGHSYVALWDVPNAQRLASLPYASGPEPKWSPDGQQVLLTATTSENPSLDGAYDEELYSISFNGQVTRQTYFTEYYAKAGIRDFSWSPDGRYIALWVWTEPSQFTVQQLAVLDTATGDVTNYCIPGSIKGDAPAPVWSPDSQQVVVENLYDERDNRRVILVDIVKMWAAQIAENVAPVGWMVSAP